MSQLSGSEHLVRALIFCLLVLPTVPIGLAWYKVTRLRTGGGRVGLGALVILMLVTCSQTLLMLGLISSDIIGPDYSSERYSTIYVNLGVMGAGTFVAAVIGTGLRRHLVTSCALVTCSWFYVAVVSSVV